MRSNPFVFEYKMSHKITNASSTWYSTKELLFSLFYFIYGEFKDCWESKVSNQFATKALNP